MEGENIFIGCDDSGYELKLHIIDYFKENAVPYTDCGGDTEPSRYPYYAAKVAAAVSTGTANRGILICGSGVGMCIAANKFKGVRAALVSDSYTARLTRRHNDSNILCMGGELIGRWTVIEIVDVWLKTEYDGGHHQGSLDLIAQMESVMMNGERWLPEKLPYPPFKWNPVQSV